MRKVKTEPGSDAKIMRQLSTQQGLILRLKAIAALYITTHNAPVPISKSAVECFYLLGDLLEGIPPDKLQPKILDKDALMREFTDG